MLRGFGSRFIFAATLMFVPAASAQPGAPATAPGARASAPPAAPTDIKLPPGTRQSGDHFVSGRGLRDSTDFLAKELSRRGIAVEQIGPYRVRGVELTRFLSRSLSTSWLAIHVLRTAGKTLIFFVPRARP